MKTWIFKKRAFRVLLELFQITLYSVSCCVNKDNVLCGPELDLYAVWVRRQSDSHHGGLVWLSCIFRPDELELPQQGHNDEEELHLSQTLSRTHARTWDILNQSCSFLFFKQQRMTGGYSYLHRKTWRPLAGQTLPRHLGSFQGWIHEDISTVLPRSVLTSCSG